MQCSAVKCSAIFQWTPFCPYFHDLKEFVEDTDNQRNDSKAVEFSEVLREGIDNLLNAMGNYLNPALKGTQVRYGMIVVWMTLSTDIWARRSQYLQSTSLSEDIQNPKIFINWMLDFGCQEFIR